jgi:DNA-binding beta-propeller fold protein YncE
MTESSAPAPMAVDRMADHLTLPFASGADRLALAFSPAATPQQASFAPYGFAEHIARFEADPAPRYIVRALNDVAADTTLTIGYQVQAPDGTLSDGQARRQVPAGTLAGVSFAVPLGPADGPDTRLRMLTVEPPAPPRTVADNWQVTALLGNLAKLLWVVGAERDVVAAHLQQLRAGTRLASARGLTLDLIGYDLGVPRFPPLAYGFEAATVALYHLDEPAGSTQALDASELYGGAGHPGAVSAAISGGPGRFGPGCAFRSATAQVVIGDHPDFAVGPDDSLTVECFVQPDPGTWTGAVLSKTLDPAAATAPGWQLLIGDFGRGPTRDVGAVLRDGSTTLRLFADLTLDTSRPQHIALTLDRAAGQATLYVEGEARGAVSTTGLGALTNTAALLIGRAAATQAAAFTGVVDEVRVSRAPRKSFHPVLGEDDDSYRDRLRIFARWTLPTRDSLQQALNTVAGPVQSVAEPFVVDDRSSTLAGATHPVIVRPAVLDPGTTIDDLGRRRSAESDVSGTISGDDWFEPTLLADASTDPRADFAPAATQSAVAGQPPADPRRMRVGTRRALRSLLDLLDARTLPGRLTVTSAFDPAAGDLRAVGRAVLLTHSKLSSGVLAALAHAAGFSWVRHRGDQADVYASVRSTDTIEVAVDPDGASTATAFAGFDLLEQQVLALRVEPTPLLGARCVWSAVNCGQGRAVVASAVDSPQALVTAAHTGGLTIEVQVTRGARAFSAARVLQVGLAAVATNDSIASDGTRGVDEAAAGAADDGFFDPAYLVTYADPRISYTASPDDRRLQPAAAQGLTSLLDLLAGRAVTGRPRLTDAWKPAGAGLETVGRALTVEPDTATIAVDQLAALAHAAGFDYVRNTGSSVRLASVAGEPLSIIGGDEVTEAARLDLNVIPQARCSAGAIAGPTLFVANAGTDSVSFVNTTDGSAAAVAKVGITPVAIAVAPDGRTVYTAETGGTLTAVDVASAQVKAAVGLNGTPVALACHPSTTAVYVALQDSNQIAVVDGSALAVTATRAVNAQPVAVTLDPAGTKLWVAFGAGAAVQTMDTATLAVSAPIGLPGPAAGIAATPARAYVTVSPPPPGLPQLVVLDSTTSAISATFTDLGPQPGAIAVTPNGTAVYVAETSESAIYPRHPDGSAAASTPVRTGRIPAGLVATDQRLYVINHAVPGQAGADNVGVLDLAHPQSLATVWPLGAGHGERLTWTVRSAATASGRLSSSTATQVNLLAQQAGPLLVEAFYAWPDHAPAYTAVIRLNPALEALEQGGTPVVIRKDQYNLVMNVLNELHPIGVEIDTRIVREHVVELRAGLIDVFPRFTFPDFRAGRRQPPPVQRGRT